MPFDEWGTPKNIIELVRQTMGSIDLDAASNKTTQGYIQAAEYYGLDNDKNALDLSWLGNVWVNPPYSAGNIDAFVQKGITEWNKSTPIPSSGEMYSSSFQIVRKEGVTQMMFLVNSSTDTEWYHTLLRNCSVALLWKGRIKFWKIENGAAHEKWEGQKSKEMGLGKIGNSPRYLSTLFYFGAFEDTFMNVFHSKGTFIKVPFRVSR